MSKQIQNLFLEEWLRSSSGNSTGGNGNRNQSSNSSAQSIIQAWAELRNCLQQGAFHQSHFNALTTLLHMQASLYVADPQAKLVISILSSPHISLPHDSYPLFLRLLYIWVRKSSKPSLVLIESAVEVVTRLFSDQFDAKNSTHLFTEGALLVGALSFASSVSGNTKTKCLELLCRILEENYQQIGPVVERAPNVLGGIGYALSSSDEVHFVRLLSFLLGDWVKIEVPLDTSHVLMILHLVEWVVYGFIATGSSEKIRLFIREAMENRKTGYALVAVLMASAGALRASKRPVKHVETPDIVPRLRILAEAQMENVATDLISKTRISSNCIPEGSETSFLLHCLSLAVARSGGLSSSKRPLAVCLGLALVTEVFPLRRLYAKILTGPADNSVNLISSEVKKHLDSILFKEAGAATGVFCTLYPSANEEAKHSVEDLVWEFCHDVYLRHREIALLLQGWSESNQLLVGLEKIAESAFLMTVVFALAVTRQKLDPKFPKEAQMDVSVKILVSFSCLEYFRRIRIPEYVETIKNAVASVQANESACVSFVQSLPSYDDLTNPQGFVHLRNVKYVWSQDEVQTARILFYLRVIPTSMNFLPSDVFRNKVAAEMFLYMGHPNAKVARASHAVFLSFIASEKESDQDERVLLKEQLVFYYMKRSLEAYPGITPFEGLASGVSAIVTHLPAGSPSIYYCIHTLVEKANRMCREVTAVETDGWKNWQGESEPCKKMLELLLRLISLVDIQVLPELMKLLAQLIVGLPKDGQNMVLDELYALVAESDDVTRKPTLVSWLQSLSYLCSKPTGRSKPYGGEVGTGEKDPKSSDLLSLHNVAARL